MTDEAAGPSKRRDKPKEDKYIKRWTDVGVDQDLSKALVARGLKQPTPIQRACLPTAFSTPIRDVIGMSRTGSGKTLAYLLPVIQYVRSLRSASKPSPSAIILCPNRELALQILKVGKAICRSANVLLKSEEKFDVQWTLAIGGDAMESQFSSLSSSPDIIVATPGRFLHLVVEMDYDLRHVHHVVYDEADRLFELGFKPQLDEILSRLPSGRQSLLFSATIPAMVAEFARAGLSNPVFHQLDIENKLSPDLSISFFWTTFVEKTAALLAVLQTVLKMKTGELQESPQRQAIIFVATKHHVEYLATLLGNLGHRVSFIYGSLHQVARKEQLANFRAKLTDIMVVTDVAARGLDIPVIDFVVNYDFPTTSQQFVHRVGRTARAGQKGEAVSFITREDLPYLVDIDTSLSLGLRQWCKHDIGCLPRDVLEDRIEALMNLEEDFGDISGLYQVLTKSQSLFERTRNRASANSYRVAKEEFAAGTSSLRDQVNPRFLIRTIDNELDSSRDRTALLESLGKFRPGGAGRENPKRSREISKAATLVEPKSRPSGSQEPGSGKSKSLQLSGFQDEQYWLGSTPSGDKTFAPNLNLSSYVSADVDDDGQRVAGPGKASQLKWDRKRKRFTKAPGNDTANVKRIRTESGSVIPASFKSGKYQAWRQAQGRSSDTQAKNPRARSPGATDSAYRKRHERANERHGRAHKQELRGAAAVLKKRRQR